MLGFTAFLSGLLFGTGLLLSGMTEPGKVLAFLDLAGEWDPSLALVMIGAIAVAAPSMRFAQQRPVTCLGAHVELPARRKVDLRLIVGSLLFGIGWGVVGICPGPAMTLISSGQWQVVLFVLAMVAGMGMFTALDGLRGAN